MIMLTAGAIALVVLNSLVTILTENELIPHLYLVVAVIAMIGFLIWGFLRLAELVVEKRYTSLSTKSKKQRRDRMKQRKELRQSAPASNGQLE